ncbi:hypothetical protein H2200_012733 [Cladophialophora chaetospira]|uniref:Uncharacterized protein n=1 Tax=Cladophialophora chaetospira TaxID=386627 RepID=A0AA38WXG3_9EURO|nr:hypothetical protein H2200_012733 [Cladophialophora chaetospira]
MKVGGDLSTSTPTPRETSGEQSSQLRRSNSMDASDMDNVMLERSRRDGFYQSPPVEDDTESLLAPSTIGLTPCTSYTETPNVPAEIFCYSEDGRLGQAIEIFRLREGNARLVATFLLRGVGLNIDPDDLRVAYTCVDRDTPPRHLVEVIRHRNIEGTTSFETHLFYCAMGELLNTPDNVQPTGFEYQLLPQLATTGPLPRRLNYNLRLAAAWIIKCGSCDRYYEINIYR